MRSLLQSVARWFLREKIENRSWDRNSPWRQGNVLPPALARKLKLFPGNDPHQKFAVVISHDCDIASDPGDEPFIEVIVGTRIEACRKVFMNARHPRMLDIEFEAGTGKMALELIMTEKRLAKKQDFVGFQPDPSFVLSAKEMAGLRSWLAARYRRAAIPDGLQKLVNEILVNTLKKGERPRAIDRIYVDFEPDAEELPDGEKYELNVVLVYDTHEAGAKETAEKAAELLTSQFKRKYFEDGVWHGVELRSCEVIADTSFTLFDIKQYKLVRLEYLSINIVSKAETHED